jgi:hypothetical protein
MSTSVSSSFSISEEPTTTDLDGPVEQIELWLQQYVKQFGLDWGKPDPGICFKVFMGLNGATLEELHDFLKKLHDKGQRPTKAYAWFVTVVTANFARHHVA